VSSFTFLSLLYDFFSKRRVIIYVSTLAIVISCIVMVSDIEMCEDIKTMLPDDRSEAAEDFNLLQQSPFARKVIINLKGGPDISEKVLTETADRLAGAMSPPFFIRVASGPSVAIGEEFFSWLIKALPGLFTDKDMKRVRGDLTSEKVRTRLREIHKTLLSPEGWAIKELFKIDPLGLLSIGLEKLRFLNVIPKMRIEDNHFLSADGRNALLIADTTIEITDSRGAKELFSHFQELIDSLVPPHIQVSLISGHRYTVANAETIKRDLLVVLSFSSLAILLLFVLFIRRWNVLFVFFVPIVALFIASAGVSLAYKTVSAMTIGFGAVLLGISVDFALHVYFALRLKGSNASAVIGQVSRPVLFGGLTTMGAFAVLLFSNLPGQRQLGVFSIIGIGASLVLSLIILPHLIRSGSGSKGYAGIQFEKASGLTPKWVLSGWLVFLILCIWQGTYLHFDSNLRSLSVIPEEILLDENELQQTWGNLRGTALIFAEGEAIESALKANDHLFAYLKERIPTGQMVSLAAILPSSATQRSNRERWTSFWSDENEELARELLNREGKLQGFSSKAFLPFFNNLSRSPAPIAPEDLRSFGLGELLDSMIIYTGDKVRILTLVPDTTEMAALISQAEDRLQGVRFVSQTHFGEIISKAVSNDFIKFIVSASSVVLLLLIILFRNMKKVIFALVPVVTGLVFMFGIMGWLGIGFNLFNIVATILIIGLGVDYGIFMVCKISEGYDHATDRAIFVSGLTTLAGFGALALARHPALHSIGVTVLLGISAAVPSALLVIPALYHRK